MSAHFPVADIVPSSFFRHALLQRLSRSDPKSRWWCRSPILVLAIIFCPCSFDTVRGWRTTGTQECTFLGHAPRPRPDLRDRFIEEFKLPAKHAAIDAPTFFMFGPTKTDGPADHAPLFTRSRPATRFATVAMEQSAPEGAQGDDRPGVDMKTPPRFRGSI